MKIVDIFEQKKNEKKSYSPPELNIGDEVRIGRWKNRKADITGFTKDENNQPVLKTTKGNLKLFKPRISKLLPKE